MAPRKKKPAPARPTSARPTSARKAAKPPVLNLKATEVKSATEKAEEKLKAQNAQKPTGNQPAEKGTGKKAAKETARPASTAKPGKISNEKKKGKTGLLLVSLAALVVAGVGGAWVFKSYFADASSVQAEQLAAMTDRVTRLEMAAAENKTNSALVANLKTQLDDYNAALIASKKTIQANAEKLAGLEKTASEVRVALAKAVENGKGPVAIANQLQFKALSEKLAGLEKNLTALKEASVADGKQELESLKTRFDAMLVRLNAAETQTGAMARSIEVIKSTQEKLASNPAASPASELASSFTILRAKIATGEPFKEQLDKVAGLMPEETALDVLRPFAGSGVATLTALTSALQNVKAPSSASPEKSEKTDTGIFGALTKRLSGLVKITKAGETDWPVLKQKALAALAVGQVESAVKILREGTSQGTAAPAGVANWLSQADTKIRVDQAVKGLSAKIVARLTAGGQ